MEKSLVEKYSEFVDELRSSRRHFLSDSSNEFLSDLKELALADEEKTFTLEKGKVLYRARKNEVERTGGVYHPISEPWSAANMKPAPHMNSEGRANPYNITMMYLASSEETAVSEVRPDVHFPVTVSEFRVVKDLKLVDFVTTRPSHYWWYGMADDVTNLWLRLSADYSKPLNKEEQRINYLQTQVIAEYFKDQGFDGLIFQSQFKARKTSSECGEEISKNFVIFDIDAVEHINVGVWKISEQTVLVEKYAP